MTESEPIDPDAIEEETYVAMFDAYVATIGTVPPSARPLVFHARKICQQLDQQIKREGSTLAAKDGAYLQAVNNLAKRLSIVPGAPDPEGGRGVPGQGGLFEYHED